MRSSIRRIAFGLVSAYAGGPIGPGRLDVKGALGDHTAVFQWTNAAASPTRFSPT